MVLTITTKSKLLEMVAFKEKEPWKMKIGVDWIEEKNSKNLLKLLFEKYKKRNLPYNLNNLVETLAWRVYYHLQKCLSKLVL